MRFKLLDGLPWKLSKDLKFFSSITKTLNNKEGIKQNAVVMGRKTWESLNKKPLPGRVNIVLSRDVGDKQYEELEIDEEKNTLLLSSL